MTMNRFFRKNISWQKNSWWKGPVSLAAAFVLLGCSALSSSERDKTPSRLLLEAQTAYDAGDYSKAVALLEDLIEKDPSQVEGRIRLAFAYNGQLGITPIELVKSFAASATSSGTGSGSSSSGTSDILKLTSKSGLPDATVEKLQRVSLSKITVTELRSLFKEFETFQKSFLTICPLFPVSAINSLKTNATSALDLLEITKCKEGRAEVDTNVSIAALTLALGQFSSLYKAMLDTDGDGQFDIEKKANAAKSDIDGIKTSSGDALTKINKLQLATTALTEVGIELKSQVFLLALAQFNIISAVVDSTNLPDSIKNGISQAVSKLTDAVAKINSYLDAGKSTSASTQTGASATQASDTAVQEAEKILESVPDQVDSYCEKIYCFNQVYKTQKKPKQCTNTTYTCSTTTASSFQ